MAFVKIDLRDVVVDLNGRLNAGGFVDTFAATTSTPLTTYSDGLGTENGSRIELDGSGQWACYVQTGVAYKFVFSDPDEVAFYTADNVFSPDFETDAGSQYVDVVFMHPGRPTTGVWIGGERATRAFTLPGNLAGSFGKVPKTLPTASFAVDLKKDNVTFGSATCSTAGLWSFATVGGAEVSFAIGDEIDAYGPTPADSTMADFGFTLAGALT